MNMIMLDLNSVTNAMTHVASFLEQDATRNFVAIVALIIAYFGGKKMLDKYAEYRLIAAASFFAPLRIYLMRLDKSLSGKKIEIGRKTIDNPYTCALFALSVHGNFSGIGLENEILKQEIENISKLSKDFLEFLSMANTQFPNNEKSMRLTWRLLLKKLILYLIDLENLSRGITVSELNGIPMGKNVPSEDELLVKIGTYYNDLKTLIVTALNYIDSYEEKSASGRRWGVMIF
jgi:hypothetical protein